MNRKEKRGGGRRRPPNERLIGRTEVARLLQCHRSTVARHERQGLLKAAVVEPDGVSWFDLELVKVLAAHFALKRRGGSAGRGRRSNPPSAPTSPSEGNYYPELRAPRLAETPKPPVKVRGTPQKRPTLHEPPPLPRGLGPRTEIRSEWWGDDLTHLATNQASRAVAVIGTTGMNPAWLGDDFNDDHDPSED